MREILFRGRRIDNGEWVYGDLLQYQNYDVIHQYENGCRAAFDVDPSTVGQYTGLADMEGVRIFEGDVLQITHPCGTTERCIVGYGIYKPLSYSAKNIGFYLYWEKDEWQHQKYANIAYWIEEREAICIGNIHDNPKIAEGAK